MEMKQIELQGRADRIWSLWPWVAGSSPHPNPWFLFSFEFSLLCAFLVKKRMVWIGSEYYAEIIHVIFTNGTILFSRHGSPRGGEARWASSLWTARFTRALRCAHSFARLLTSLAPWLVGKPIIRWLFCLCFFSRVHATLQVTVSVCRSVGWSVCPALVFCIFELFEGR